MAIVTISSQGGLTKYLREPFPPTTRIPKHWRGHSTILRWSGVFILVCLGLLFIILTALPMIGGALGAKVLEKQ